MNNMPKDLEREYFRAFGDYEDLLGAADRRSGGGPCFLPDFFQFDNNGKSASVSASRVSGKPVWITSVEIHHHTCEGILPLDGDIFIFAAPPHWFMDFQKIEWFRVPRGTMVKLKAGVLHGTPVSVTGDPVNVLILLPERTYAVDCEFTGLSEDKYLPINFW
jgi:ureidoglycolate lyase